MILYKHTESNFLRRRRCHIFIIARDQGVPALYFPRVPINLFAQHNIGPLHCFAFAHRIFPRVPIHSFMKSIIGPLFAFALAAMCR